MALTTIQKNWLSIGVDLGKQMAENHDLFLRMTQVYFSEGIGNLTTEDIQALPEYGHLTNARVVALETAIEAMSTALGDFTTGQAGNFLKAANTIK